MLIGLPDRTGEQTHNPDRKLFAKVQTTIKHRYDNSGFTHQIGMNMRNSTFMTDCS